VQPDLGQHRPLGRLTKASRHELGVQRLAVLLCEDETGLDPELVPLTLLVELARRLSFEHFNRLRIESDGTATPGGLGFADHDFATAGDEGAAHGDASGLEIDVVPE
jgi:hypothetical protein